MSREAATLVVNRLRERVLSVLKDDPESAIRMICDEIDWIKQEHSEDRAKKGRQKSIPELSIVSQREIDQCVQSYIRLFFVRYGSKPGQTQRLRRECHSFCGILGDEALKVMEYYLLNNDPNAVKNRHSMADLLSRAEVFHSEWQETSNGKDLNGI